MGLGNMGIQAGMNILNNSSLGLTNQASIINNIAAHLVAPESKSACAFSTNAERDAFVRYCQDRGIEARTSQLGRDYVVSFGDKNNSKEMENLKRDFCNAHGYGTIHEFNRNQDHINSNYTSTAHVLVSNVVRAGISAAESQVPGLNEAKRGMNIATGGASAVAMMAFGTSASIIKQNVINTARDIESYRVRHGSLDNSNPHYESVTVIGNQAYLRDENISETAMGKKALQEHQTRYNVAENILDNDGLLNKIRSEATLGLETWKSGESGLQARENMRAEAQRIMDSNYGLDSSQYTIAKGKAIKNDAPHAQETFTQALSMLNIAGDFMNDDNKKLSKEVDSKELNQETLDFLKKNNPDLYDKLKDGNKVSLSFEDRLAAQKSLQTFESSMFRMDSEQQKLVSALAGKDGINALKKVDGKALDHLLKQLQGNSLSVAQQAAINKLIGNSKNMVSEMAALEEINRQLKTKGLSTAETAALQARQAALKAKINNFNTDLQTAMNAASEINKRNGAISNDINNRIGLTAVENEVIRQRELRKDLEKDFGISANGKLKEDDLYRFKKDAYDKFANANVNIFHINGTLDAKRLNALTESELKKIGLTTRERDLLLKLHYGKSTILAKKISKLKKFGSKQIVRVKGATKLTGMLAQSALGEEMKVVSAAQYSMSALQASRKAAKAVIKYNLSSFRATKAIASRFVPAPVKNALPQVKLPLRNQASAFRTGVAKVRENVGHAAYNYWNHTWMGKAQNWIRLARQRAKGFISNNKVSQALHQIGSVVTAPFRFIKGIRDAIKKLFAAIGSFLLGAASMLVAFVCVYMLIGSLADAVGGAKLAIYNYLAPADYGDTVAYQLYNTLKDDEDAWINHLGNVQAAYENKDKILYGEDYKEYKDYIALHPELTLDGDNLYINPFFTKSGFSTEMVWKEEDKKSTKGDYIDSNDTNTWKNKVNTYLTKTDKYDGINSMNVGTNDNMYTQTSGKTYGGYIANLETGHTSNIKDIIAMTDIMYQHEMDAFFDSCGEDAGTAGIMGSSHAQITYANMSNKLDVFGWDWKKLLSSDNTDAGVWERLKAAHRVYEGQSVSYSTVTAYAENLFNMTHQDQWFLDVDFFECNFQKTENRIVTEDDDDAKPRIEPIAIGQGDAIQIGPEKQSEASHLETCLNPVVNPFYIKYVSDDSMLVSENGVHVYGTSGSIVDGKFKADEGADAVQFITDTGLFPVNVGMNNILEDKVYAEYLKELQKGRTSATATMSNPLYPDTEDNIVDGFVNKINFRPEETYYTGDHEFNPAVLADPEATRMQNLHCLDDEWKQYAWEKYDPNQIAQYTHITSGYCKCWELKRPDKVGKSTEELAKLPDDKHYKGELTGGITYLNAVEHIETTGLNDGLSKNSTKNIFNWGQLVTKSKPDESGKPNQKWDPHSNYKGLASYEYNTVAYSINDSSVPGGSRTPSPEEIDMIESGDNLGYTIETAFVKDKYPWNTENGSTCSDCDNPMGDNYHYKESDVSSIDIDAQKYYGTENLASIFGTDDFYGSPNDVKNAIGKRLADMIYDGSIEKAIRNTMADETPESVVNKNWYRKDDDVTDGVCWYCKFDDDRNTFTVTYYETIFTILNRLHFNDSEVTLYKTKDAGENKVEVDTSKVDINLKRPLLYRRLKVKIPAGLNGYENTDLVYDLPSDNSTSPGVIMFYDYDKGTWLTNLMKYESGKFSGKIRLWEYDHKELTEGSNYYVSTKIYFPYVCPKTSENNPTPNGTSTIKNYDDLIGYTDSDGTYHLRGGRYATNRLMSYNELIAAGVEVEVEGEGEYAEYTAYEPDPENPRSSIEKSHPRTAKVYFPNSSIVKDFRGVAHKEGNSYYLEVSKECVDNEHTNANMSLKVKEGVNLSINDVYYKTSGLHSNVLSTTGKIMSPDGDWVEYDGQFKIPTSVTYEYYSHNNADTSLSYGMNNNVLKKDSHEGTEDTYEFRRNVYDLVNKDIVVDADGETGQAKIILKYDLFENKWYFKYHKVGFESYQSPDYSKLVDALLDYQGHNNPDTYDGWDVDDEKNWINLKCLDSSNSDLDYDTDAGIMTTNAAKYDSRADSGTPFYVNTTIYDDIQNYTHHIHTWTSGSTDTDGNYHPGYCTHTTEDKQDVRYTNIDKEKSSELGARYGAVWNQIILCKKRTIVYKRNCQGHLFAYCGGHIGAHAHGVVYSATNEQMAIAGVKDDEKQIVPLYASNGQVYDIGDHAGTELIGKIDESNLDYTSFSSFIASGCCAQDETKKQGSIWHSQSRGPNLMTKNGSDWAVGDIATAGMDNKLLGDPTLRQQLKDIFDVDMGISYACNVFPLYGEWENYEGWTEGNMSMCIGKITGDWYDLYGFDIPLEIGDHIAKGTEKSYVDKNGNPTNEKVVTPDSNGAFTDAFEYSANLKAQTISSDTSIPKYVSESKTGLSGLCNSFLSSISNFVSDAETAAKTPGSVYVENKSYYSYHLFNTPLSVQDIEAIDTALCNNKRYKYANEPDRQEHVRRVLGLIGQANAENYMGKDMYRGSAGLYMRGSVSHETSGFLTSAQNPYVEGKTGVEGNYISTTGGEASLIHYLLSANGNDAYKNAIGFVKTARGLAGYAKKPFYNAMGGKNTITAQPGDYIYMTTGLSGVKKYGSKSGKATDEDEEDEPIMDLDGLTKLPITNDDGESDIAYDIETLKYYAAPFHAAVFIGVFDEPIRLSSGQEIQADVPVYVEMSTISKYINYSHALEISQDIPSDLFYAAKHALYIEEDPDKVDAEQLNIMKMETAYGIMEYTNGARSIGGIFLHGAYTDNFWFRKNRTDAFWVCRREKNPVTGKWEYKPNNNVYVIDYKGRRIG